MAYVPEYNLPAEMPIIKSALFTEDGDTTYTYDAFVPAGSMILDVVIHGEVLWNDGTSASMEVGDYSVDADGAISTALDADGFFTAVNLKATDLTAGQSINFDHPGAQHGAYVDMIEQDEGASPPTGDVHVRERVSLVDRFVRFKVAAAGGDGTAGRTFVALVMAQPPVNDAVGAS